MSLPLSRKGRNPNGITFSLHKELTIKNKKGTQDDCGPFFFYCFGAVCATTLPKILNELFSEISIGL